MLDQMPKLVCFRTELIFHRDDHWHAHRRYLAHSVHCPEAGTPKDTAEWRCLSLRRSTGVSPRVSLCWVVLKAWAASLSNYCFFCVHPADGFVMRSLCW